jgi:ADP-ribosyl-[dinitrogen reductase] hydrolase
MAMCLVRSFIDRGAFDPSDIATRFVGWLDSSPPDIGMATRKGLTEVKRGVPWNRGGIAEFERNKNSAANGSLMRNAPVVAMATSLGEAFEFSLKQSIITHYGPLPVVCCCAQSFLIWRLLEEKNPLEGR